MKFCPLSAHWKTFGGTVETPYQPEHTNFVTTFVDRPSQRSIFPAQFSLENEVIHGAMNDNIRLSWRVRGKCVADSPSIGREVFPDGVSLSTVPIRHNPFFISEQFVMESFNHCRGKS